MWFFFTSNKKNLKQILNSSYFCVSGEACWSKTYFDMYENYHMDWWIEWQMGRCINMCQSKYVKMTNAGTHQGIWIWAMKFIQLFCSFQNFYSHVFKYGTKSGLERYSSTHPTKWWEWTLCNDNTEKKDNGIINHVRLKWLEVRETKKLDCSV